MPLATFSNLPDPRDLPALATWSLPHANQHISILSAIQANYGVDLEQFQLDPMPAHDLPSWLLQHQQMHQDMNGVLGLSSNDLVAVDLNDPQARAMWSWLHFMEHQNISNALNVQ